MSLMNQHSDVNHTIRQSEIPALLDSSVTNMPSAKTLKKNISSYLRKKNIACLIF